MNKEDYDLEVRMTIKQCCEIEQALDFVTRICAGQLNELRYALTDIYKDNIDYDKLDRGIELLREAINQKHSHYGISSPEMPEWTRECYDIQQELRYRRSWLEQGKDPEKDDRKDMFGVCYDEPLLTAKNKDNIWCRSINKIKEKLESI